MKYSKLLSAAAAFLLTTAAVVPTSAQDNNKLTLEDIYKNYTYSAKGVT